MIALPGPLFELTGMGAVTAVGHSVAQTTASWVGQIRRLRHRQLDALPEQITVIECTAVAGGRTGVERLQSLLPSAVVEALEGFEPGVGHARRSPGKVEPLAQAVEILVLPPWVDAAGRQTLDASLTSWLDGQPGWRSLPRSRAFIQSGATGAWEALELAYRRMRDNPALRHVLIAAVDTWCEPTVLARAGQQGLLMHKGNSEGFIAGEAAACVRLERVANVMALGTDRFALHRPGRGQSAKRFWPAAEAPDSAALTSAVRDSLTAAGLNGAHLSHLASDMDGSAWRARLEGEALGRTIFADAGPKPSMRAAELLGQIGTPTGLLSWILPVQSHLHGIERINTVLGWGIDPEGSCAAAVLERAPS